MKCDECDGFGWRYSLPPGCNPFEMKLPLIAQMMQKRSCFHCQGSGTKSGTRVTVSDEKKTETPNETWPYRTFQRF